MFGMVPSQGASWVQTHMLQIERLMFPYFARPGQA